MKRLRNLLFIISASCIILTLAGCAISDTDEDYGEAYDSDYLTTEYVDQLVRDGADTIVGTIEITGDPDTYVVNIAEKKVVKNDNYEDGYYIADKNITSTYPLGSDLGILVNDGGKLTACTTEDFLEKYSEDKETLYTVYLIGDVVELIQPLDPKQAAAANN